MYVCLQILPVSPATKAVRGDRGKALYELVFIAAAPPLGYNTYFVRHSSKLGSLSLLHNHVIYILFLGVAGCVETKATEHLDSSDVSINNKVSNWL